MTTSLRIGLDFDNTLITYDDVFLNLARERGLTGADFLGRKQAIRDAIRLLPDGELSWQQLQGQVYGKGVARALMFDGVGSFLKQCRQHNVPVVIVSHKTEFGHHDPERVNLRQAALDWMTEQGFFRGIRHRARKRLFRNHPAGEDRAHRAARLHAFHRRSRGGPDRSGVSFRASSAFCFREAAAASVPELIVVCPTWRRRRGAGVFVTTRDEPLARAQDVVRGLLGEPADCSSGWSLAAATAGFIGYSPAVSSSRSSSIPRARTIRATAWHRGRRAEADGALPTSTTVPRVVGVDQERGFAC